MKRWSMESLKQWSGRLLLALVSAAVAFGLTLQLKNERLSAAGGAGQTTRAEQPQLQLEEERAKSEALYTQLQQYQQDLDEYKQQAEESGGYAAVLAQELERASLFAGLTRVQGEGLTVTMRDSQQENTGGVSESFFIIHDEDILRVVNELRDAGAEALSINGERLLATSEIRCSGSTVSINNTRYSVPYVITAIGDADEMERALTMRQGVVDVLSAWGIELTIEKSDNLVIEPYTGTQEFRYAQTVEQ